MHSAGLKLTKLTYTRVEDNLIRHRGDRLEVYHYLAKTFSDMTAALKPLESPKTPKNIAGRFPSTDAKLLGFSVEQSVITYALGLTAGRLLLTDRLLTYLLVLS